MGVHQKTQRMFVDGIGVSFTVISHQFRRIIDFLDFFVEFIEVSNITFDVSIDWLRSHDYVRGISFSIGVRSTHNYRTLEEFGLDTLLWNHETNVGFSPAQFLEGVLVDGVPLASLGVDVEEGHGDLLLDLGESHYLLFIDLVEESHLRVDMEYWPGGIFGGGHLRNGKELSFVYFRLAFSLRVDTVQLSGLGENHLRQGELLLGCEVSLVAILGSNHLQKSRFLASRKHLGQSDQLLFCEFVVVTLLGLHIVQLFGGLSLDLGEGYQLFLC